MLYLDNNILAFYNLGNYLAFYSIARFIFLYSASVLYALTTRS
jgi:nucleoside-diphosphate-sugar epimerase